MHGCVYLAGKLVGRTVPRILHCLHSIKWILPLESCAWRRVPGPPLLPLFACNIKSWWGLGTRLHHLPSPLSFPLPYLTHLPDSCMYRDMCNNAHVVTCLVMSYNICEPLREKGPLGIKSYFPIIAKMWGKLIFFIFLFFYFIRKCRNSFWYAMFMFMFM